MGLGGNDTMTPRERVVAALHLHEPDRVPINYAANPGIDARLKAHFGVKPDDHEGLLEALGVDFRGIHAPYTGPRLHPEVEGRHVDPLWGIRTRWIEHGQGGYWDFCDFPLKDADEDAMARWPMPSPDDFDYGRVAEQCRRHDRFGLFVGGAGLGDILNQSGMIRSVAQVMMDLISEDPAWLLWVDRKLAIDLEVTTRTLEAAQGRIDFLWMGEDLGSQDGPLIGLDTYRRVLRPRHQKLVDLGKAFGIPVMVHTCGSSSWVYEDFIEMGVTAVDTLQPEAARMAPAELKARFGGRLAFHGCISTAGAVSFGSVDDVVRTCTETLEIMMPGGGYCFAPTHALQDNSPTENVVAMYETAHRVGRYS